MDDGDTCTGATMERRPAGADTAAARTLANLAAFRISRWWTDDFGLGIPEMERGVCGVIVFFFFWYSVGGGGGGVWGLRGGLLNLSYKIKLQK